MNEKINLSEKAGASHTSLNYNSINKMPCDPEESLRIYRQSLNLVLIQAVKDLFPQEEVRILYSVDDGFYGELVDSVLSPREAAKIEERMWQIVIENRPIVKQGVSPDKHLAYYSCGSISGGFLYDMLPSTGFLKVFKLHYYRPGFVLQYPRKDNLNILAKYIEPKKLSQTLFETKKWAENLNLSLVSNVAQIIKKGDINDLICLSEALHEKKISQISDLIFSSRPHKKLIMISGPSSSGKTTFIERLSTQLRVNGLKPVTISLDNYYLPRDMCPKDEAGQLDFETIEALDIDLFNNQLSQLIQGQEVEMPIFDFNLGGRRSQGVKTKINDDQIIMIEGIHGLNERLTKNIPREKIFKIYISALTQLNVDNYNRIPTTDLRLIRRIVRDYKFRNTSIIDTLQRWPSVRKGEIKYIFPHQEKADVMFNSSLIYELNVLRPVIEPLLKSVAEDSPYKQTALRLKNLISFFDPIETQFIPFNSILREFIGGSCFKKH